MDDSELPSAVLPVPSIAIENTHHDDDAVSQAQCGPAVSGVSSPWWPRGLQPPGSSVHGVPQASVLGWVATPSSGVQEHRTQETGFSHIYFKIYVGINLLLVYLMNIYLSIMK